MVTVNHVKTIVIKKKWQNRKIPLDTQSQQCVDELYKQYGCITEYEKSIFIVKIIEKFSGLDDYEKYYNSAKKLHDLNA